MGASSVTGSGSGGSNKLTTTELAILANGPSILIAGTILDVDGGVSSPPSTSGTVRFSTPLEGLANNYVVIVTGVNTANTFVSGYIEEDGNFTGFTVRTEDDGDVHYIVTKKGIRATF